MTAPPTIPPSPSQDLVFGRQPAIWVALAQMLVGGIVLFAGEDVLTETQATLIVAVVNALLGLVVVWKVAEWAYPALGALVNTVVALVVGFGVDLTEEQQGWIMLAVPAVVAMIIWPNLHPIKPALHTVVHPVDPRLG